VEKKNILPIRTMMLIKTYCLPFCCLLLKVDCISSHRIIKVSTYCILQNLSMQCNLSIDCMEVN